MKPIRFYSGCSKKKAYAVLYAGLILLLLILVACNICIGSVNIPLSEVVSILGGKEAGETVKNIILQIRFPRALAAVILGGALALSGYLLQTFFHNPLAGPFVLGISSGANLIGAVMAAQRLGDDPVVITVFSDDNKKYLSTDYAGEEPMKDSYYTKDLVLDSVIAHR